MDIFSYLFVVKIVMFVRKDKNKQKEAGDGTFFKNNAKTGIDPWTHLPSTYAGMKSKTGPCKK